MMGSMPRTPVPVLADEPSAPKAQGAPAGARVLVVDDDPDFGRLLVLRLKGAGIHAEWLETAMGLSARLLESPTVDLVMLDCMMPALTGPTVLGLLGRHPRLMKIPVILMSASTEFRDSVSAHPLAVFVEKDGRMGAMTDTVTAMLAGRITI